MRRPALLGGLLVVAAALAGGAVAGTPIAITDPVWSGYAASGATFNEVKGTWVQPTPNCGGLKRGAKTTSSVWIGLDGFNSNTVEQAGTEANCDGTTGSQFAWFEFYPAKFTPLPASSNPVLPGDTLTVDIVHSGGTVTITFSSSRWNQPFVATTSDTSKDQFSSAEWIVEGLSQKLTNFGTVTFTNAHASTTQVSNGAIDDPSWTTNSITMVSGGGQNQFDKDTVSPLTRRGDGFTVTWQNT